MSQVIKHAHKQHEIKLFFEFRNAIDGKIPKLNLHSIHFRSKPRLVQVFLISVNSDYAFSAALLHLDRIKTCVATNIEDRFSRQVIGNGMSKALPFDLRVVSEKVTRSCLHAAQVEVVKPLAQ